MSQVRGVRQPKALRFVLLALVIDGLAARPTSAQTCAGLAPFNFPFLLATKKVALEYVTRYDKQFGSKPPIFGAGVYDSGLLLSQAIPVAAKKGKPGTPEFRAALRDVLEATRDLVTSQGVVNMSAPDHSGYDQRGRVLLTVKDGKFSLVKD